MVKDALYLPLIWTYADAGEVIEEHTHTVVRELVAKAILVGVINPLGDEEWSMIEDSRIGAHV